MSSSSGASHGHSPTWRAGLHLALGPRGDTLESTRWLFLVLALASGLIVLPQAFLAHSAETAVVAVVASLVLAGGLVLTYRTQYQDWRKEAVEVVAIGAFAYCATQPAAVFGVIFARLWFRSLYDSRRAALARPFAYMAALVVVIALPGHGPAAAGSAAPFLLVWSFPIILFTAVIARRLASSVHVGSQNSRLDAVQVSLGADVLGVTDPAEIRRAGWRAHAAICDVVPDLRLIMVSAVDDRLDVIRAIGTFAERPTSIPAPSSGLSAATTRPSSPHDACVSALNAAAGEPCSWVWVRLPALRSRTHPAWFVMGAPGTVPGQALAALTTQMNHVSLAMSFAELHGDLIEQATHDALTGLLDRAAFLSTLSSALDPAIDGPTSVLFVDLDDFKEVNDLFGHRAGDQLLVEVAHRLRDAAGPSAECGRIGGDEFAVLLTGADATQAAATANRIAHHLTETTHADGTLAHIGACIGVATADGGVDAEDLVHRADVAMYTAKSTGKGRISAFDCSLPRRDAEQAAFERQLADAARAGQLVVHYQPVLSLPNGRCTAVEALVRWQHPDRGLISPALFIPTAERTGAIRSIGAWVLRQALHDTAVWRRRFPAEALSVHVNVSALQLEDDDLLTEVSTELAALALDPAALVLEVTESLAISSPEAVRRLNALAEHGVLLAIDDFGTGYSALQTLRSLPIQIVKIDRSFVAGCSDNPEDRAVTEAIVQMAGKLGIRTVAEGVEQLDQQAFLESIGTTGAQGYLYRRPGTAAELTVWFEEHLAARADVPHQASARIHDAATTS